MKCDHIKHSHSDTAMVLLHGWCCNCQDLEAQVEYFKDQYSIILPDYTNFILEKVNLKQDITFNDCINEVDKVIRSFGYSKLIFVGHSMGGAILLSLACKFQSELLALFILDTTISSDISSEGGAFLDAISKPDGGDTFLRGIHKMMVSEKYDNVSLMKQKVQDMCNIWHNSPKIFSSILYQAIEVDKLSLLKELNVLTVYLTSKETPSRADFVKNISNQIRTYQLPAGHFLMFQASDKLNQVINKELS